MRDKNSWMIETTINLWKNQWLRTHPRELNTSLTLYITKGFIDEMTVKWFNQTPDPPRIPVFYTLTKIHKPTLVVY